MKKVFPRFDAILTLPNGKVENMKLTLVLRLGMKQINPAGGAAEGTYHDYGPTSTKGRDRKIIAWTDASWSAYKRKFAREVETFWSTAFHLKNPGDFFGFSVGGKNYAPHTKCALDLKILDGNASTNHHNIEVVRLHSSESFFGSHSKLYDSKDIELTPKRTDSGGHDILQKAHVHEIGHLLGLGHVNEGKTSCPSNGDTNASACYGITDTELNSVMGSGMKPRVENASPWQMAMRHFCTDDQYKMQRMALQLLGGVAGIVLERTVVTTMIRDKTALWQPSLTELKPTELK